MHSKQLMAAPVVYFNTQKGKYKSMVYFSILLFFSTWAALNDFSWQQLMDCFLSSHQGL